MGLLDMSEVYGKSFLEVFAAELDEPVSSNLESELKRLYGLEWNIQIYSEWDIGWTVTVENAAREKETATFWTVEEVTEWLRGEGMNKYSLRVFWSGTDGEWVATCPEFPGLSALAPTRVEAVTIAEELLKEFIDLALKDGDELPETQTWKWGDPTEIGLAERGK